MPFLKTKGVCTTCPNEDIVAAAAIDRLAVRAACDDVVSIIAEGVTVAAGDRQVFEIVRQRIAHPCAYRIDAFVGCFIGLIEIIISSPLPPIMVTMTELSP